MSRRFSPQLLFELRNHIPIDVLIENVLAMPTTGSEKYFRFSCPICSGFHTVRIPVNLSTDSGGRCPVIPEEVVH